MEPLFSVDDAPDSATSRMMLLRLGSKVRDDIVRSDFDQGDGWSVTMTSALLLPVRHFTRGWSTMAEVEAPPVAWECLARWCHAQVRKGRLGEGVAASDRLRRLGHLARKIDRELDRLANHPAYRGEPAAGTVPMILPFYQWGAGPMAPTPARALRSSKGEGPLRSGVLLPYRKMTTGGVVTAWEPSFIG